MKPRLTELSKDQAINLGKERVLTSGCAMDERQNHTTWGSSKTGCWCKALYAWVTARDLPVKLCFVFGCCATESTKMRFTVLAFSIAFWHLSSAAIHKTSYYSSMLIPFHLITTYFTFLGDRQLRCVNYGGENTRCALHEEGRNTETNPGCFDELDEVSSRCVPLNN